MTQAQECAHRFATTREQRQREETNAVLHELDLALYWLRADWVAGIPPVATMAEVVEHAAEKLRVLGVDR